MITILILLSNLYWALLTGHGWITAPNHMIGIAAIVGLVGLILEVMIICVILEAKNKQQH